MSAGLVIHQVLTSDSEVMARASKVFPLNTDSAVLPYVSYRRTSMEAIAVKNKPCSDTTAVEVLCFAKSYGESVDLAEAVRAALDGCRASASGLEMRVCTLADSTEMWEDDAFIQQLIFNVKI